VQREIGPALAAGAVVVSDRYDHSSLAYQGTGAERAWIARLNERARRPDLTLLLRVRPEVAAARRVAAGRAQELFEDLPMQERVAAGYDAVVAELTAAGERIEVLDGEASPDEVASAIARAVAPIV
jgi:dTMP kinase